MRAPRIALLCTLPLALAACGGSQTAATDGSATTPTQAGSTTPDVPAGARLVGRGADAAWVFAPAGKPKAVVIFVHGLGDQAETTPVHHQAWIDHLVARGDAVVYPRYELRPGADASPTPHVLAGVVAGVRALRPGRLPRVVIGYSRGGRLALDYASVAGAFDRPPAAVLSVFPGAISPAEPALDLRSLDPATWVAILVGDRDHTVGYVGARELLARLRRARFPERHVSLRVVRSHGGFVASHLAPLDSSAAARAAFWRPADELVAWARRRGGGTPAK